METIVPVITRIRNAFGNMPMQIKSLEEENRSLWSKNSSLTSTNEYLERRAKSCEAQIAAFEAFANEVDPPTPVVEEDEKVEGDPESHVWVDPNTGPVTPGPEVVEPVVSMAPNLTIGQPDPGGEYPMPPEHDDGEY